MTLQVFQAVTLNTSAYQPHALLMRILSAEGPSILREYFRPRAHNKSHRQLGLVQIRIALQEVCNVINCYYVASLKSNNNNTYQSTNFS